MARALETGEDPQVAIDKSAEFKAKVSSALATYVRACEEHGMSVPNRITKAVCDDGDVEAEAGRR